MHTPTAKLVHAPCPRDGHARETLCPCHALRARICVSPKPGEHSHTHSRAPSATRPLVAGTCVTHARTPHTHENRAPTHADAERRPSRMGASTSGAQRAHPGVKDTSVAPHWPTREHPRICGRRRVRERPPTRPTRARTHSSPSTQRHWASTPQESLPGATLLFLLHSVAPLLRDAAARRWDAEGGASVRGEARFWGRGATAQEEGRGAARTSQEETSRCTNAFTR